MPVDDSQLANVLSLADEIDWQIQTQQTEIALQKGADTDQAVEEAQGDVAAAKKRFTHFGYGKTTMAEVAADCDMSPGNLYRFLRKTGFILFGHRGSWYGRFYGH